MHTKHLLHHLILIGLLIFSFMLGAISNQIGILPQIMDVHADNTSLKFDVFMEAWQLIETHFIDRDKIDSDELTYIALKAITDALGDEGHTRFMTPDESQSHKESLQGSFFGIGIYLGLDRKDRPFVINPIEGTPAYRAGIKAGDLFIAVEGEDATAWTVDEIARNVKGPKNTPVEITFLHQYETKPYTVTIIRDKIVIPVVDWTFIPNSDIALIRFVSFSETANDEMKKALTEAQAQGATAIILDIRSNNGGLLSQSIEVASQFIAEGVVLQQADVNNKRNKYSVYPGGIAHDIPLVILVNQFSASAAEILAGAIQDHKRGTIIGETTFGTGTVLTPFTLSDGSQLLLGTSEWLTADGRQIRNKGITPDIIVKLPNYGIFLSPNYVEQLSMDELFQKGDIQLIKAIEFLRDHWGCEGCL